MDAALTFHVVGDAYVDLFCFLEDGLPESGGDSRLVQPICSYAGGSSTNTATHLHALIEHFFDEETTEIDDKSESHYVGSTDGRSTRKGKPTVMLHTVFNDKDRFGKILSEHGQRQGFEIFNCYHHQPDSHAPSLSTGHCVAIVSGGERSFMTHQGCVGDFSADDLDLPRIINTKRNVHVHIAGFFNVEGFHHGNLKRALEQIRTERKECSTSSSSTVMSLVTQHDASKQWDGGLEEVAPYLDFLIMNELEANSILNRAGYSTSSTLSFDKSSSPLQNESVEAWVKYFSSWDPTTCVIVTLGPQGAVAFRNHELVGTLLPAIRVEAVDPTGAGDSFTAGFLHGLWEWERDANHTLGDPMITTPPRKNGTTTTSTFQKIAWPGEAIQQGILWGCAVGTSAVTVRGASNPAPPETIQKYYDEQCARVASSNNTTNKNN
ncbi:hypothetical protein ACA910_010321 [Epithemia clementina (nom. ined.)]